MDFPEYNGRAWHVVALSQLFCRVVKVVVFPGYLLRFGYILSMPMFKY